MCKAVWTIEFTSQNQTEPLKTVDEGTSSVFTKSKFYGAKIEIILSFRNNSFPVEEKCFGINIIYSIQCSPALCAYLTLTGLCFQRSGSLYKQVFVFSQ